MDFCREILYNEVRHNKVRTNARGGRFGMLKLEIRMDEEKIRAEGKYTLDYIENPRSISIINRILVRF